MPGDVGLYYPWIHFRDDDWVKLAMLYWKRVQRIVPHGYATRDSAAVSAFVDRDLIRDVESESSARRVGERFGQAIVREGDSLVASYGVDRLDRWKEVGPPRHFAVPAEALGGSEHFAFIHVRKITAPLREALHSSGLAVTTRMGDPEWIGVHPKIARVYMTALAEDMAHHGRLHPVTEEPFDHVSVGGLSVDSLLAALLPAADPREQDDEGPPDAAAAFAYLAIRSAIPSDISTISADRIIEVRDAYGQELADFQRSIRQIVDTEGLDQVSDPPAFQMHLEDAYEESIAPRLAALKREFKLMRIDTASSWLTLQTALPPVVGAGVAELGFDQPVATGGAAVLLGAVTVRGTLAARAQASMRENPAAYMLRLQENLGPNGLRQRLRTAARQLFIGV